jgi:mono/diheme cytochrome c family protein
MKNFKLFVAVFAVSLYTASCSQTATPNAANGANSANSRAGSPAMSTPAATPPERAMDAKEIYAMNCMICHKDTGKGGKVTIEGKAITPDDLTADKFKKMTDEKLIGYVTNGIEDEGMPAFKDKLTPEEIRSVITHVRTLQK